MCYKSLSNHIHTTPYILCKWTQMADRTQRNLNLHFISYVPTPIGGFTHCLFQYRPMCRCQCQDPSVTGFFGSPWHRPPALNVTQIRQVDLKGSRDFKLESSQWKKVTFHPMAFGVGVTMYLYSLNLKSNWIHKEWRCVLLCTCCSKPQKETFLLTTPCLLESTMHFI